MTHFAGLVLVAPDQLDSATDVGEGKAFSAVASLVSKYCEDGVWGEDGTRYDWFTVGGRATGLLDDYKPWEDERNYETCRFCEGTGTTTQAVADQYPAYREHVGKPCVQCNNPGRGDSDGRFPGKMLRFGYEPHANDVMPARNIDMDRIRYVPNVIVTPDGEWHEGARYGMFAVKLPDEQGNEPKEEDVWRREFSGLLEANRDAIAVVVDFHV